MKLIALLIIPALFLYHSRSFAQTQNYSGTWVLNNDKSKINSRPEGMTSSVFIIKQAGNHFSLTIHHIFNNLSDTIIIKMLSDGRIRHVLNTLNGKLEQKENYLQITLWQKGFLDKVKYKFGRNKNEFIADEVLASGSDNHHNIWVFDRRILN